MKLTVDNITKQYPKKLALDKVSFSLEPGIYGFLGPNGAGKSTLVNIISGVLLQTGGKVLWNGIDIHKAGDDYRKILGFQPQVQALYKSFTAGEFLEYMAVLKGLRLSGREMRRKVDETLSRVNLLKDKDRKIGEFSGGMKQRVLIGAALINDPQVLILDEPTAGLDPKERVRLRNEISAIGLDRIVIWTTHIVSDVEFIAKEILLIKDGHLLRKDTPMNLADSMEGKVRSVSVPREEVLDWQAEKLVANIQKRDEDVLLRIVGDYTDGVPVKPTLEDVYMYYFNELSGEKI